MVDQATMQLVKPAPGFTFIQILISLFLVLSLVLISAPSFQHLYQRTQIEAQSQLLLVLLRFAREEALRGGGHVRVCPSMDGKICSNDWQQGILVYRKSKEDELIPLRVLSEFRRVDLHWHGFLSDAFVEFSGDGMSQAASGHFSLSALGSESIGVYKIVVNRIGRVRIEKEK